MNQDSEVQPEIDQLQENAVRKLKPWTAFFMSLFLTGFGQVYNGQLRKGAIFFGLEFLLLVISGMTRMVTHFYGLLALLIIGVSWKVFTIADAVNTTRRLKTVIRKPYNTLFNHTLIFVLMYGVLWFIDFKTVIGAESFTIPTTSNYPTFQIGDHVTADLKAFKNTPPAYGDIVVYTRPQGPVFAFRVIGLPGDRLSLKNNILTINGKPCKTILIKETSFEGTPVFEFEEELPNGHKHRIYVFKDQGYNPYSSFEETVVPAGNYFLLGDNRDNAVDSRFEGFISSDRLYAKILYTQWGKSANRINIDLRDK